VAASDQQLAGSADSAGMSGSGGSDRGWRGQNCDPIGTVAMGRAQFTAELIFQYSNYLQTLKYKMKVILMSKNIQTWNGGRVEHYEQLSPTVFFLLRHPASGSAHRPPAVEAAPRQATTHCRSLAPLTSFTAATDGSCPTPNPNFNTGCHRHRPHRPQPPPPLVSTATTFPPPRHLESDSESNRLIAAIRGKRVVLSRCCMTGHALEFPFIACPSYKKCCSCMTYLQIK
jgi:hypothetical protein